MKELILAVRLEAMNQACAAARGACHSYAHTTELLRGGIDFDVLEHDSTPVRAFLGGMTELLRARWTVQDLEGEIYKSAHPPEQIC
jgi:hypothetical protein